VAVAEDDDVIEAFPADRADQPLPHARSARVTEEPLGGHAMPMAPARRLVTARP